VVGPAALVASRSAGAAGHGTSAAHAALEPTAAGRAGGTTTHSWVGAVARQMAGEAARVAAAAGAAAREPQGRAVSLDVPETLAVVALLRCLSVSSLASWWIARRPWRSDSSIGRGGRCDVLSVVRGCGHPFDSWPGCLPMSSQRTSKSQQRAAIQL
jgi:hypothetical protein